MRPGETLRSERVIEQAGPMSVAYLRYWYEWYKKAARDALIPAEIRSEWVEFLEHVNKLQTPGGPAAISSCTTVTARIRSRPSGASSRRT